MVEHLVQRVLAPPSRPLLAALDKRHRIALLVQLVFPQHQTQVRLPPAAAPVLQVLCSLQPLEWRRARQEQEQEHRLAPTYLGQQEGPSR
jgi:hypothetical protein